MCPLHPMVAPLTAHSSSSPLCPPIRHLVTRACTPRAQLHGRHGSIIKPHRVWQFEHDVQPLSPYHRCRHHPATHHFLSPPLLLPTHAYSAPAPQCPSRALPVTWMPLPARSRAARRAPTRAWACPPSRSGTRRKSRYGIRQDQTAAACPLAVHHTYAWKVVAVCHCARFSLLR